MLSEGFSMVWEIRITQSEEIERYGIVEKP
jgi:hypothetical protein